MRLRPGIFIGVFWEVKIDNKLIYLDQSGVSNFAKDAKATERLVELLNQINAFLVISFVHIQETSNASSNLKSLINDFYSCFDYIPFLNHPYDVIENEIKAYLYKRLDPSKTLSTPIFPLISLTVDQLIDAQIQYDELARMHGFNEFSKETVQITNTRKAQDELFKGKYLPKKQRKKRKRLMATGNIEELRKLQIEQFDKYPQFKDFCEQQAKAMGHASLEASLKQHEEYLVATKSDTLTLKEILRFEHGFYYFAKTTLDKLGISRQKAENIYKTFEWNECPSFLLHQTIYTALQDEISQLSKRSDHFDLTHCISLPYVGLFFCDKRIDTYIQMSIKIPEHLKSRCKRSGDVERVLETIRTTIE